jgi:cell division protein FtsQ
MWSRVPKPGAIADACGRALRRSLPAVIGGAVLAAVGGPAYAGYHWVTTSSRFAITHFAVQGNHHLTADQILAAVPVHAGDNLFATNLGAVDRALLANPWIADAEVHRMLPHTVVIDVREHVPAAVADLGGLYLVDSEGHAFKRAELDEGDGAGLPVITGLDRTVYVADPAAAATQVRGALSALDSWHAAGDRPAIAEVHLDPRGAIALVTGGGTSIELGTIDTALPTRMRTFDTAWAELADGERERARAIHLDPGSDHVTVAFKDQ